LARGKNLLSTIGRATRNTDEMDTTESPIGEWYFELEDWWTASALRHVDKSLCGEISIGFDEDGDFFMRWKEDHPELGTWEDFFGDANRTEKRCKSKEWLDMIERLPSRECEVCLTGAEAYEVFIRASVPSKLHAYAGLAS
jgi:hypothetical protein